ncbi:MAG: ABC transporter ATP-binding protein [Eubacteriales bacterium]|nr:ABC transporter ATP-binding protein [Eubacteriales bacterium]
MERHEKLEASLDRRYGKLVAKAGKGGGPGNRGAKMAEEQANAGTGKNRKQTIARLFKYVLLEKNRMIGAVVCSLLSTVLTLATSYMLRPIINTYIVPVDGSRGDLAGLIKSVALMFVLHLLSVVLLFIQMRLLAKAGQNSLKRLRTDLYNKLQKLPVKYYDTHPRGDIMSRFTNDVDNVGMLLGSTLITLLSSLLTLIGTVALMFYTNWLLSLIIIFLVPFTMFFVSKITKASSKYFSRQQASLGAVNGYIEEMVTGQKVIKVFNHEDMAVEEFGILNERLRKNQFFAQFFGGLMGPVSNASNQVIYTVTAVVAGILCVLRGFDIGGMTVFLNYTRQFGRPVNEIAQQATSVLSALAGAERVFAVMDELPEPEDDEDAYIPEKMSGYVKMENVYFGYKPEKMVLKNISLYAKPGQKIAFVGSTGAGKTTITNLINRFYDIQQGTITIDDVDIKHYPMEYLRKNIAVVLQDTHLFTGTIMENIRYGRLDATDAEVIEAAKLASAYSFIKRLPDGFNTMIEGDGANLSQGQRQLINIARAAISKAPILVLDEATSSVDTRTEKHIEQGMDALMTDRTTFVIAHRLSTVRDATAIMVLENGEIIERGSHDELLNLGGRYYELYTGKKELD